MNSSKAWSDNGRRVSRDQLGAAAGMEFHIVDDSADGDVGDGQGVAGLDIGVGAGLHLVIQEDMVGHKLGEFAPTRTFRGHAKDK